MDPHQYIASLSRWDSLYPIVKHLATYPVFDMGRKIQVALDKRKISKGRDRALKRTERSWTLLFPSEAPYSQSLQPQFLHHLCSPQRFIEGQSLPPTPVPKVQHTTSMPICPTHTHSSPSRWSLVLLPPGPRWTTK